MISRDQQVRIISRNVKNALWQLKGLGVEANDLADVAELSRSTVKRLLDGETMPNGMTITKLCKALFCEPGDLLPTLANMHVKKEDSLYGRRTKLKVVAS